MFYILFLLISLACGLPTLQGSLRGYLTYDEVNNWIHTKFNTFPLISKYKLIGKSLEGREINGLCLGKCDDFAPQAFYNAMHHSREPLSMMTLLYFVEDILEKYEKNDPATLLLLHSRQLWVVPLVNPDGYEWNRKNYPNGGGMQRKNRRPGCARDKDVGVDINRNYDICFGVDQEGSSSNSCSDMYEGAHPFSEPESLAIKHFVESRNFSVAFNYHSFGKAIYIPYSCKRKGHAPSPDDEFFIHYATQLAKSNNFLWGQPWASGLYTVNGDAADWMYANHGIFAVSPEVSPNGYASDFNGFWPSSTHIKDWSMENIAMNYLGAWTSGSFVKISSPPSLNLTDNQIHFQLINAGVWDSERLDVVSFLYRGDMINTTTIQFEKLLGRTLQTKKVVLPFLDDMESIKVEIHDGIQVSTYIYNISNANGVEFRLFQSQMSGRFNESSSPMPTQSHEILVPLADSPEPVFGFSLLMYSFAGIATMLLCFALQRAHKQRHKYSPVSQEHV